MDGLDHGLHPHATAAMSERRRQLAPQINDAFTAFSRAVFAAGSCPN